MNVIERTRLDAQEIAAVWLQDFGRSIEARDAAAAARLFSAD